MKKKIILITPFLQPYRITFYQKLSEANEVYDLYVFHGVKKIEDGRPGHKGETAFKEQGFTEYKKLIGPYEFVYNKGMFAAVKEINPDLVIMQTIAANLSLRKIISWAKRNNRKVIQWVCGWEPERVRGFFIKFKNIFVKTFLRKTDYFLTYSTKAGTYIKSFDIDQAIVETCYNGIEIDYMVENKKEILKDSLKVRKELDLENKLTFIYVGGFHKEKRIDLLVHAFERLREKHEHLKLLLIGDGPTRPEIESLIKEYNDDNILYLGRIIDGVDSYFAASDCLVLPGVGGLALNQAMFWEKPCIVSEADGTEDDIVIDGFSGYRFIKGDLDSLTDAMERRILEKNEVIAEMGINARVLIEEKNNVNNMVRIFMENINKQLGI